MRCALVFVSVIVGANCVRPRAFTKKVGHIIYVFLHGDVSNIFYLN